MITPTVTRAEITHVEIQTMESICQELFSVANVRFVGIINRMGKLVAGGFKSGVIPHIEEEKIRMMYMQLVLDVSMRKDFDEYLGPINYILCERENVTMVSIPKRDFLALIFLEPEANAKLVVNKTFDLIQKRGLN